MASPVFGVGDIPSSGAITTELSAVTRRAFVPKLVVQIYKAAPSFSLLMRNAQRARGGLSPVTVPIQGSPYVQFNWTGYDGSFAQPANTTAAQAAAWNLSVGTVPVPLLGMESLTQVTEAVIPLVKARMADCKTVFIQALGSALFGSAGTNPLAINGFLDAYDDGTNAPNYGNISRSTNPFWKSTIYSTGITPSRSTMITRIMAVINAAGGEKPDFILMSLSDWTTLVQDYMTAEQFHTNPTMIYGNDDVVNAGFSCLMLAGVPILADPFCPKGTAFVINSKYLALYIHENANFAWSGFHSLIPNNQLGSVGVMISAMALACTKPVSGAQLSNVTGGAVF